MSNAPAALTATPEQRETLRQALYTMNGLLLFQIGASLAAIMGGLGLTLAVIGLYGVVSYAVGRRVHEIGLRMALGASRASVFRMIYRQSVMIVAAGLAAGLAMALLVARAVGSMVVVSVWDGSDDMPVRQDARPDQESGRGLMLAESLGQDWGAYQAETGKVVWVSL